MRLIKLILSYAALAISTIIAFVFIFIEIRPVFAGDFKLLENPALGVVSYLFRAIFYFLMIVNAILIVIDIIKKNKSELIYIIFNATLVGVSFLTLFFYDWYISLALALFNVFTLLIRLLNINVKKKNVEEPKESEEIEK